VNTNTLFMGHSSTSGGVINFICMAQSTGVESLKRLVDERLQRYAYPIKGEVNRDSAKNAKQQRN
jgi:hypothetical protein